jgi:hypothetical protein
MGRIARLVQWLPGRRATWRVVDCVASGADVPSRLPPRGAILVRAVDVDRFLAFDCPCAGRHRLLLDLDMDHNPTWTVRAGNPLTVWPSVDYRHNGERCHFVLRHGQVRWVPNDE